MWVTVVLFIDLTGHTLEEKNTGVAYFYVTNFCYHWIIEYLGHKRSKGHDNGVKVKILPLSLKPLSEGTGFQFSSSISICSAKKIMMKTMISNTGTCALLKKEKLMPINPEFVLLKICRIRYCMAIINTEQWSTFQNVSFIALYRVFLLCLGLN